MLLSTFSAAVVALASLVPSVAAAPTWPGNQPRSSPNLSKLATMMPKNTLQAPGNLQLKFVGLGIGTQNYTCNGATPTAEPGTTGAVAKVYDLGTRLNNDPLAKWKIGSISGLSLQFHAFPQLLDGYLMSQGYQRILGDHFFTLKVPTFSLNKVPSKPFPIAYVTKNGTMDAPASSCPGTKGEGAIPWLYLSDAHLADALNPVSQGGVNTVYRLETAGGNKPKTCQGMPATFEVPYAAQYWVYGPK